MARLEPRLEAGPSGACGLGALLAIVSDPALRDLRRVCRIGKSTRPLAIATEGK